MQKIAPGVSSERELTFGTARGYKLRADRDKLAAPPSTRPPAKSASTINAPSSSPAKNNFTCADT
ncbi:hypothetical protein [Pseudomonas sp. GW101-3H06]|uniref:hypothetical protein n=1 Tax=Pseudomonas sp. GW101-3H06 TaxID=2751347 RepID=UPI00216B3905|nr:hypothetical protein [Pseudomonas sp. GW101-3H06]